MDIQSLSGDALVAAHRDVTRKLRIVSLVFPVLFIGLMGFNLKAIAEQIQGIDGEAVGRHLSDRMNSLMPDITMYLEELADEAQPALVSALEKETSALAPVIEKQMQSDVELGMQAAKSSLRVGVDKALQTQADAQRQQLLAAFPELASDAAGQDAVLEAVRAATRDWSTRQLDATVAEHVNAMDGLRKTLEGKYAKDASGSADPEDALMTWLNLMNEHVGGDEDILGADGKTTAKRPAGKE